MKYKEIVRLSKLLTDLKVVHSFQRLYDGFQIICFDEEDLQPISVVEHEGSYGSKSDLLEMLCRNEEEIGFLTAEKVIEYMRTQGKI